MKTQIISAILKLLNAELTAIVNSAKVAHEAATHEESKAEDQYDTRGLEASYLAAAQSLRAEELRKQIAGYKSFPAQALAPHDAIRSGSLVELESDGKKLLYFLVSQGGGMQVEVNGRQVQILSMQAPLGQALLDKKAGDVTEVQIKGAIREYEILAVS